MINGPERPPWPRRLINFPIIMFAVAQQILVGFSTLIDPSAQLITSTRTLSVILSPSVAPVALIAAGALAAFGFWTKKKIRTLVCLIPQQLFLYVAAGGAIQAIILGRFADGVERTHAFLLADQLPVILLAFFHTWAMLLILRYAEDF